MGEKQEERGEWGAAFRRPKVQQEQKIKMVALYREGQPNPGLESSGSEGGVCQP